jgi:hypothetical protein
VVLSITPRRRTTNTKGRRNYPLALVRKDLAHMQVSRWC